MCSCSSRHCGLSVRRLANMLILYDCLSTFSFFSKLGFRSDDFATVQMYHFFDAVTGKRPYFQTLPDNCLWRNFQIKSMISIHTLDFNYQYICLWKLKLVVVTAPWNLSHPKKKKRKKKKKNFPLNLLSDSLPANMISWFTTKTGKRLFGFTTTKEKREINGVNTEHIKAERLLKFYKAKEDKKVKWNSTHPWISCFRYMHLVFCCLLNVFFFHFFVFQNFKWKNVKWPHLSSWKSPTSKAIPSHNKILPDK